MPEATGYAALLYQTVYNLTRAVIDLVTVFERQDSIYSWPYLLTAALLALGGHLLLRRSGGILRDSLSRRVLWHRSSRADYAWFLVNSILFGAAVAPFLFGQAQVAEWFAAAIGASRGDGPLIAAPAGGWSSEATAAWRVAYTLGFFVAYDFGRFLAHWLQHVVPLLWQFHKVHHSAECLNIFTSSRAHPVDLMTMAAVSALTGGVMTGLFLALVGPEVISPYVFLGQHVLIVAHNTIGNLRHTHVWLGYGRLEALLVSPAMHQLHHSALRPHWNKNHGFTLAIWDRLFGTWHGTRGVERFPMGLGDGTDGQWHSVWRLYVWPFRDAFALLRPRRTSTTPPPPLDAS